MYYSIRKRNIQKKNKRKSLVYVFFTIIVIVLFFFLGVKILVNIINLITDIKKSDVSTTSTDSLPPRVPLVYSLPEYTSNSTVEIKGDAESGSSVILIFNGKKDEVVSGSDGVFLFKKTLIDGINDFYLYSIDNKGNKSSNTRSYKIAFDDVSPELSIVQPLDGSSYYGFRHRVVEIKGQTENDSSLSVNGMYTGVSSDGTFIYKYELNVGENKIEIISIDRAGNEEKQELTLYYQE